MGKFICVKSWFGKKKKEVVVEPVIEQPELTLQNLITLFSRVNAVICCNETDNNLFRSYSEIKSEELIIGFQDYLKALINAIKDITGENTSQVRYREYDNLRNKIKKILKITYSSWSRFDLNSIVTEIERTMMMEDFAIKQKFQNWSSKKLVEVKLFIAAPYVWLEKYYDKFTGMTMDIKTLHAIEHDLVASFYSSYFSVRYRTFS